MKAHKALKIAAIVGTLLAVVVLCLPHYARQALIHLMPVIDDLDKCFPGVFNEDADIAGSGIYCVLKQLLDSGRGPLHDLSGSDQIRYV